MKSVSTADGWISFYRKPGLKFSSACCAVPLKNGLRCDIVILWKFVVERAKSVRDTIIWFACVWGCAVLFLGTGIYAEHRKKPMWFWAGSDVSKINVTDVKSYNKAHGIMWKTYSIWYWITGVVYLFSMNIALVLLILSCTIGFVQLCIVYNKIEEKYIVK